MSSQRTCYRVGKFNFPRKNDLQRLNMCFLGKNSTKNANFGRNQFPLISEWFKIWIFLFYLSFFFIFYGFLPIDFWCGPWASMNRWPTGPAGTAPTRFGLPSEGTPLGLGTLLCLSPQWERAFSIRGQTAESRPTREAITDDHPTSWPVRVG